MGQKENIYPLAYLYNSLFLFLLSIIIFFLAIPITQFKNFQFFGFIFAFVSFIVAILFLLKFLRIKKGEEWENIVNKELSKLDYDDLFRNVHVPEYGDMDNLLISKNGIFVIESKHYSGNVEVSGDDWYVNDTKIKSPSIQIKKIAVKFKELLGINIWLNCIIVPIVDGKLQIKNSTVNIVRLEELLHFIEEKKGFVSREVISAIKSKINELQVTAKDNITLKGLFNSWWFSNYKRFFVLGIFYGILYLIISTIFEFIAIQFYRIDTTTLPIYTLTENMLAIFYVGVLPVLFGKIIFDILKIDLKIELFNIMAMVFIGWLPFFIYDTLKAPYLIGQLAEIITRLVAILISYFILKIFKFDLTHIYLK